MSEGKDELPGAAVIKVTAAFPGVVAIVVAITYICGIAIRTGQLRDVGLAPLEQLSIYPAPDFLAQGITSAFGAVLFAAVIVAASAIAVRSPRGRSSSVIRPPLTARPKESGHYHAGVRSQRRQCVSPSLCLRYRFPASDPGVALGSIGYLFFLFRPLTRYRDPRRSEVYAAFACLMAGAAPGFITQAFFDPPPFPDVRLTRTNRTTVNGRLIATENGSYYVEINGDVDVIPQLQTVDVLTSSHHASATIWPALWLADHI